jgi:hypothetical protein
MKIGSFSIRGNYAFIFVVMPAREKQYNADDRE